MSGKPGPRLAQRAGAYKPCKVCGTVFYVRPSRIAATKFCSFMCGRIGMKPRKKRIRPCKACGAQLQPCNWSYCSMACRQNAQKAERVRDGNARCAKCRTWKPIAEFVKGINGGPHSYCKLCSSVWFHERRGTPLEARKPYRPLYVLTEEEKALNRKLGSMLNKKRRAAAGPWPSAKALRALVMSQESRCAYCLVELDRGFHFDHKMPIARGGTNAIENLHATCARCNQTKQTMTHDEFMASKKRPVVSWS